MPVLMTISPFTPSASNVTALLLMFKLEAKVSAPSPARIVVPAVLAPEILTLIDGRLTFDEVVAAARVPRFEAARIVAGLVRSGAISASF